LAEVIPFPTTRRRTYIRKQAARMASLGHDAAERHLERHLNLQAASMSRKGVSPALIARETRALELAIRVELWRMVLTPEGAA